jgi:hypothetical protein
MDFNYLVQHAPDLPHLLEKFHEMREQSVYARECILLRHEFPFLFTSLPTMGMVEYRGGRNCQTFTQDTVFKIAHARRNPEQERVAFFSPIGTFPTFPGSLRVGWESRGKRLQFEWASPDSGRYDIQSLRVYTRWENYRKSLSLQHMLTNGELVNIEFWDQNTRIASTTQGKISFGLDENYHAPEMISHPVEKVRSFFHFPEQRLYLNFDFAEIPPTSWNRCKIEMTLPGEAPGVFSRIRDISSLFHLSMIPVVNLHKGDFQPILLDGKKDRYPLRHPDGNFIFHSLIGIYLESPEGGKKERIWPKIFGGTGYELEESGDGTQLSLQVPKEVFDHPRKLTGTALWSSKELPDMSSPGNLKIQLYNRTNEKDSVWAGLVFKNCVARKTISLEDLVRYRVLLQRLTSQPFRLGKEEVVDLLKMLGVGEPECEFREMLDWILDFSWEGRSTEGGSTGCYQIRLHRDSDRDLARAVGEELLYLLNSFSPERFKLRLVFEPDRQEILLG